MLKIKSVLFFSVLLFVLTPVAFAMANEQRQRFEQVYNMDMTQLTAAAEELLDEKYPDEDWDQYRFPSYVFTSDSVEMGYRIAVKEHRLLGEANVSGKDAVIPCYCFCDAMGHKNLLYCFLKNGTQGREYDDHAANCNICYGQAMLAFLWNNVGATHDEIIAGMERKFSRLIKMKERGKL